MQSEGVRGNISVVGEYQLNLVPLDSDIMSMEAPLCYRETELLGDRTSLYDAAHAIMQLQVT